MPVSIRRHVLHAAKHMARKATGQFDYPATKIGATPHVNVWLANKLSGAASQSLAQAVLRGCEQDYLNVMSTFGLPTTTIMDLVIAPLSNNSDGSGGAYHYSCGDTVLYCDADINDPTGNMTLALFVAEAVEVAQAIIANGWDCGASNGEGLSRTLAEQLHPGILDSYSTAGMWLDGARTDWVDTTDPTDQSADSTGCSVLFLWWLNAALGFSWNQITTAGGTTLAQTYDRLTKTQGTSWGRFTTAVNHYWPPGTPSGVATDNPWPSAPQPAPTPTPAPPPPAPPPTPAPTGQPEALLIVSQPLPAGVYSIGSVASWK